MLLPDNYLQCPVHTEIYYDATGSKTCPMCKMEEKMNVKDHTGTTGVGVDVDGDGTVDIVINKKTKRARKPSKKGSV